MQSIQILSDLHLEAPKGYDIFEVVPSAPYLALLGDIGCVKDPRYFDFITKQLSQFKVVFLLLGNHEPYGSSWTFARGKLRDFEKKTREENVAGLGSFVFLDQTRFDLSDEITVLGCTLYSNIIPSQTESVGFGLNDFYYIEDWTTAKHNLAHESDLEWLNTQVKSLSESDRQIIILTHHSPTVSSLSFDPAHTGSQLSSGFSSDLSDEACWLSRNVWIWAFGHSHYNCDYLDNGKRVVTNQRGYSFRQAKGYDGGKTVGF